MTCRSLPPKGYAGQRYEVWARDGAEGPRFRVGWTSSADGNGLTAMIEVHPTWTDATVTDLCSCVWAKNSFVKMHRISANPDCIFHNWKERK